MGPGLAQITAETDAPAKKQRPFLSNRTNSKTISGSFAGFNVENGASSASPKLVLEGNKENGHNEVVVVSNSDLEKKVADLSAKIAELTALIMAQQGSPIGS